LPKTSVTAPTGQAAAHAPCPTQCEAFMSEPLPEMRPRTSCCGQALTHALLPMHSEGSIFGWSVVGSSLRPNSTAFLSLAFDLLDFFP